MSLMELPEAMQSRRNLRKMYDSRLNKVEIKATFWVFVLLLVDDESLVGMPTHKKSEVVKR